MPQAIDPASRYESHPISSGESSNGRQLNWRMTDGPGLTKCKEQLARNYRILALRVYFGRTHLISFGH